MSVETIILNFSADKLAQSCTRIESCVDRLTPEQIWSRNSDHVNAVGNLMLHLSGNVRQWILHGVGGAPDVRTRDAEFDATGNLTSEELKLRLRSTVDEACAVLCALPPERLQERRIIQKSDVTVLEAILHVVEHFSGHTGQIIFITKFLTGEDLGFYAHLRSRHAPAETPGR
jgi:uncharacterized damage-inducible protein DinB